MGNVSAEEVRSFEFEAAVSSQNADVLRNAVDGLTGLLRQIRRIALDSQFNQAIEYQIRVTDWLAQKYSAEKNVDYLAGLYIGLLYAVQECIRDSILEEQAGDKMDKSACIIPHFEEVLFAVQNQSGIRHGELAKSVGVDRSTLTGIMDRIVQSGAVIFSRPGKFKYYYLTELGARYCRLHRQQNNLKQDKEALLDSLVSLVGRSPRPEKLVGQIMELLYEKKQDVQLRQSEEVPDVKNIPNVVSRVVVSRPTIVPSVFMDSDCPKDACLTKSEKVDNLNTEPFVTFAPELSSAFVRYTSKREAQA